MWLARGSVGVAKGRAISSFGNAKSTAALRASSLRAYSVWLAGEAAPAGARPLPLVRVLPDAYLTRERALRDAARRSAGAGNASGDSAGVGGAGCGDGSRDEETVTDSDFTFHCSQATFEAFVNYVVRLYRTGGGSSYKRNTAKEVMLVVYFLASPPPLRPSYA
jgi:hypothetical protein